ncbi:hypothetical protein [Saccharothrix algeriensis]|uniref:Secreted protein n=1 Tax=Saccharothrix algeriensis TaxID=173560 RepID=A0A8T8I1A8_9PSEU|nr:hypothetical protein [Saccharothrix algeriensis]MBM7810470.1 hypothetical protein [Saccharothrix algeriensis]QTR04592.1 hypothetical protein J7S33_06975 [Saccharothrix algeriensis]
MTRSFLGGLASALGALALLVSTAVSAEEPVDQPSVNVVVPNDFDGSMKAL